MGHPDDIAGVCLATEDVGALLSGHGRLPQLLGYAMSGATRLAFDGGLRRLHTVDLDQPPDFSITDATRLSWSSLRDAPESSSPPVAVVQAQEDDLSPFTPLPL